MKYFAFSVVFVFAALLAQAQTNNPTLFTYRQKQLNDTLQMLFPDLKSNEEVPVQYNTSVLPLKNEGIKVGSNNRGELYSMNVDKMPCLKPYKTADDMPNAVAQKPLALPSPKEKQ